MKKGVITMLILAGLLLIACRTTAPSWSSMRSTKVEQERKKLADLNATQNEVTKKLIEKRNLLLSMPKDSPPTREVSRQLAILNKQATDLVSQVFGAELALEKAIDAEAAREAAADANATARAPESSVSGPDVPALPGTKPEQAATLVKKLDIPDVPDVGDKTVFHSFQPGATTKGLSWDTSDELDHKPLFNGKPFTGKVQYGLKDQEGKILRIDSVNYHKNGEFLYSYELSDGYKHKERWSVGDGKYIQLKYYPNVKHWVERVRGTREITVSVRGRAGLVEKEKKIYDLKDKLIYHKKEGRVILDDLANKELIDPPAVPETNPSDKPSIKKRVLNSSEHDWSKGLAPWTADKPVNERYQVMFVDEEEAPFFGDRILYGGIVIGDKNEKFLHEIESFNQRGEKVSVTEFDVVEPTGLKENSFAGDDQEQHAQRVAKVFKVKYTEYDKIGDVIQVKKWNNKGELVK